MSRINVTPRAFALLACSVLLIASIGCTPGTPTAPSSSPQIVESPNFIRILSASKGVQDVQRADGATQIISAEDGGVITNGRVTLEFPPFALDRDTEITIEMLNDGTLGVELGPHGIQFNRPVIMTMDLKGTSAEGKGYDASTLWFNDMQGWYEVMPKIDSGENQTQTQLNHFSKYVSGLNG